MSNGLTLKATRTGTQVVHAPAGVPTSTVILETPWLKDAKRVMASLLASGVDWTQPHTRENHAAMREAIVAATSDGNVKTATF